MRALLQRVKSASVKVDNSIVGEIGQGLLLFLGLCTEDTEKEAAWLIQKVVNLRIFADDEGKMNLSVKEAGGGLLVVSQFTLYGNCMNGRRPDFISAMRGEQAERLYVYFVEEIKKEVVVVATGRFGADMEVSLINDGPVTFMVESPMAH